MSISPLLIEIIIRLSYFAKSRHEGHSFKDSIPFEVFTTHKKQKLQTMLFSAHLIATAANAGKVAIAQNPLMINYPQWIAFFRYAIPQLKWLLSGREKQREEYIQDTLNQDWQNIDRELEQTWNLVSDKGLLLR